MSGAKARCKRLWLYTVSLFAIVLWGMSYIWSDELLRQGIPVEYFVFVRVLVAGFILLLFNIIVGYDIRIRRKDSFKFLLLAFCEPFIYFVCETYGIQLTESPTYSALVIATTPIFSLFAGLIFFRERFNAVNIIGFVVCLAGIILVTVSASETGDKFIFGVLLLIVAVLAEVGHASCTKWLSGDYKPQVIVMYQFLIGAAYLFPLFMTKGMKTFDYDHYLSWNVLRPIFCLALLCSSIAFSLWVNTIKHLGVAKSSIFMAMIPVVTALAGCIIGNELLTPLQWGGVAVACGGVVMSQVGCSKNGSRYRAASKTGNK